MRTRYPLHLGCTVDRHRALGIHAVINARAGRQDLNDFSREEIDLHRDAFNIRQRISERVRFYQFNSRFFRRRQNRLGHLLSRYDD